MVAADRGEAWAALAAEVAAAAETTPNLHLLPTTAPGEVLALYPRAVAIVSTSHFEGFPNTFLEAWAHGTPALSLRVDPDRVIERHGLGAACGGSLDELAAAARRFWTERRRSTGDHLRAYVERVHHPAVVGREWATLVEELLR
jgi:glycosyltransferase involved in cell wall biosynthesis